jgi:hypothetical protein
MPITCRPSLFIACAAAAAANSLPLRPDEQRGQATKRTTSVNHDLQGDSLALVSRGKTSVVQLSSTEVWLCRPQDGEDEDSISRSLTKIRLIESRGKTSVVQLRSTEIWFCLDRDGKDKGVISESLSSIYLLLIELRRKTSVVHLCSRER